MSAVKLKNDLYWVGAQDPDLKVFDVIMETKFGTSYNSYLLTSNGKNVLFETVKLKHFDKFINNLKEIIDPKDLDYIVINHTEPDHAGSVEEMLKIAPNAKVIASQIALDFLKEICNTDIPGIAVGDTDIISVGKYNLKFLSVPFLHWPDSIYTYIEGLDTLITCDSFGCHYSNDKICNDLIDGDFLDAYQYYFNMIFGPFKKHVQYALKRIKEFNFDTICPGHGPVLRKDLDYYIDLYDKWSQLAPEENRDKPKVVCAYVSAYGYTEEIANDIKDGILSEVSADIELYDMVYADHTEVQNEIANSDGFLLGSPTVNGDALPPVMNLAMGLNGINHSGKTAGAFGSYGWSGEAVDMIMQRLKMIRMNTIGDGFKVKFKPSPLEKKAAKEYGVKFAKKLHEKFTMKTASGEDKTFWKCVVCGEIFEGALPPLTCSVCGVGSESFIEFSPDVAKVSKNEDMSVTIIGGGVAAVSAAKAIRIRNNLAKIDIYSSESIMPYYRPALTKAFCEDIDNESFYVEQEKFYKENNINIHLNTKITNIDKKKNEIITSDSQIIGYNKLIMATGANCTLPPIKGIEHDQVYTVRSFKDVNKIMDKTSSKKRICIVGGGILGLEMADSLHKDGHEISIVEVFNRILPHHLDKNGSNLLEQRLEEKGINLNLGTTVKEIAGMNTVEKVITDSGTIIDADLVIISAGVSPNIGLAKVADLETSKAIHVNSKMQTSDPNIYAIGDCTTVNNKFFGVWEAAIEQGKTAGANIAGEAMEFKDSLYGTSLTAFDLNIFSVGDLGSKQNKIYKTFKSVDEIQQKYKVLYFDNNKIVGGILYGDTKNTNTLMSLVKKNADIEEVVDSGIYN